MQSNREGPNVVVLKRNWDYSPHIDDFLGEHIESRREHPHCHVIRVKEMELLMDFLTRRSEGALLISGKRGVGKTSVMSLAISDAYEKL